MRRLHDVFPAVLLFLVVSPAHSFEIDGFKSGMTIDQAIGMARSNGYVLTNRNDGGFTTFSTSLSTSQALWFCHGQLVAYYNPLPDVRALIISVDQTTKQYGKASYSTAVYEGSAGIATNLGFYWNIGDERLVSLAEQYLDRSPSFSIQRAVKSVCD
jgi:hypothetical protein